MQDSFTRDRPQTNSVKKNEPVTIEVQPEKEPLTVEIRPKIVKPPEPIENEFQVENVVPKPEPKVVSAVPSSNEDINFKYDNSLDEMNLPDNFKLVFREISTTVDRFLHSMNIVDYEVYSDTLSDTLRSGEDENAFKAQMEERNILNGKIIDRGIWNFEENEDFYSLSYWIKFQEDETQMTLELQIDKLSTPYKIAYFKIE